MSKDDLMKKWAPIIDSMGVTGSKADWLSQYAQMRSNNESKIEENTLTSDTEFPSLLPMAMQVASKTVGLDLVSVQPLASPRMSQEELHSGHRHLLPFDPCLYLPTLWPNLACPM